MLLGPPGRHLLEPVDGFDIHLTNVRRAFITDTPPLTLEEAFHCRFGQLRRFHQSAAPLGELLATDGTPQPLDGVALPGPGPVGDVTRPDLLKERATLIGR